MPAYKDTTTGKWYVQFWHTDYHGKKKKKMKRGFTRKSDALKWESEYKLKMAGSPDMTFASLMEHYLDDSRTRMKASTMQTKVSKANNYLLPYFGELPITAIDARKVRNWQNSMLKKELKPSYLKLIHGELSAVFNYGIRYYGLTDNPAKIAGAIGSLNMKASNFWTLDEFNRALEQVTDIESKMLFTLLFWTGMRFGEALALTLNDFNFANKTVRINKTKNRISGDNSITAPKTEKSNRTIALSDEVIDQVQQYVETFYDYNPKDLLFGYGRTTFTNRLKEAARIAEVKVVSIHSLRHAHASLLIEMGFSPLLISERLGHDNVTTTMNIYSHLYPNKQQDIADGLNNLKNGIKTESSK